MSRTWNLKPKAPIEHFQLFPNLHPLAAQMLYNRGLLESKQAGVFLSPEYSLLYSPFLFRDMQKSVNRIFLALEKHQKICIYGDYDADAVTANAVLQQTFRHLGCAVSSYIPDRFSEGYGLNLAAFEKLRQEGARLVISVDCGTNSREVAEFCKRNGIDLIITDHHELTGPPPASFALINPKNPGDHYPDSQITGVGVAYKLAQAILSQEEKIKLIAPRLRSGQSFTYVKGWDKWLLDLVAIGTVADCHSLLGENRILVSLGLKVLAKTKWLGLRALCQSAGLNFYEQLPDTYTLGFVLAPRINAAGRLEHADLALDLLMAQDIGHAQVLAAGLEKVNRRRQEITARLVSEARAQAELILDRKILMLYSAGWPKGVVGLVAGRLATEYSRPVVILEKGEVESTGSGRSTGNFNLLECLKSSAHLLSRFGGHKQAAGLTLKNEHLGIFYENLLRYAESNLREDDLGNFLELEAEISAKDISLEVFEQIQSLEPFGVDNPKPKFLLKNCEILNVRSVGKEGQHAQLQILSGAARLSAIAFNFAKTFAKILPGRACDLAVELLADAYNGQRSLKLRVVDVKFNA